MIHIVPGEISKEVEEIRRRIQELTTNNMNFKELLLEASHNLATNNFSREVTEGADVEEDDFVKLKEAAKVSIQKFEELIESTDNGIQFYSKKRLVLARYERGIRLMNAIESQCLISDFDELLSNSDTSIFLRSLGTSSFDQQCVHVFPTSDEEFDELGMSIADQLRDKLIQLFNYNVRDLLPISAALSLKMKSGDDISVVTAESAGHGPLTNLAAAALEPITEYMSLVARMKLYLNDQGFDPESKLLSLMNQFVTTELPSSQMETFSRAGTLTGTGGPFTGGGGTHAALPRDDFRLDSLEKLSHSRPANASTVAGTKPAEMTRTSGSADELFSDYGGDDHDIQAVLGSVGSVTPVRPVSSVLRPPSSNIHSNQNSRPQTSIDADEQPYLIPIFRGGLFATDLARMPLKRGFTLVRGADKPYIDSIRGPEKLAGRPEELEDEVADDATFDSGVRLQDNEVGNYNMPISSTKLNDMMGTSKGGASRTHHIRVNGPGLLPLHARFSQQGGVNIHITPNHIATGSGSSIVLVNGASITESTVLKDGDFLQLGFSRFFKICIPRLRADDQNDNDDITGEKDRASRVSSKGGVRTPVEKIMRRQQQFLADARSLNQPTPSKLSRQNKAASPTSRRTKFSLDSKQSSLVSVSDITTPAATSDVIGDLKDSHCFVRDLDADSEGLLTNYEFCMHVFYQSYLKAAIRKYETARRHTAHLSVDREGASIATNREKSELMLMDSFEPSNEEVATMLAGMTFSDRAKVCELIAISVMLSYWSKDMRRGVLFEVRLRAVPSNDRLARWGTFSFQVPTSYTTPASASCKPTSNASSQHEATGMTLFSADILCTATDSNGNSEGCWWWNVSVLLERLSLLHIVRNRFLGPSCNRNSITLAKLYPEEIDPFVDTLDVSDWRIVSSCSVYKCRTS
jgi:hypothetical protein